jgi:hypothetical protein
MPVSDEQMNRILTNIAENIPSDCSTGRRIKKGSTFPGDAKLNSEEFDISEYEAYRNDIEFVNSFSEQVLADEQTYFTKKYGEKVYNFLLSQRNEYITEKNRIDKEEKCKSCPSNTNGGTGGTGDASGNTCTNGTDKDLYNYLLKQNPIKNPDTTFKKIEYRDESHEYLSRMNNLLTIFYFCILFVMFIVLVVTKRLMIKERLVLYIFLIVLPFAFPYLFDLLKKLYKSLFTGNPTYGPKNAFLENRDTIMSEKAFHGKYDSSLNFVSYNDYPELP